MIALLLVLADLLVEAVDGVLQAVKALLVEGGDADVADIAFPVVAHRIDGDLLADELHVERLLDIVALDGERDRRVDRAAHLVDRLVEGHAVDLLAVEGGDQVVGEDAGAGRRGVVDRGDNLDEAVLHGDLDAEAAELAAGLDLHVLEVLRDSGSSNGDQGWPACR